VSGIAGVFHRTGRPADAREVEPLLRAIRHRGPDRSQAWASGPIGLGHCLLATTPESVGERQPLHSSDGQLAIVFDGRIDNREELADEFARARTPLSTPHDAEYVLAAYRVWGDDCPARLLGDFAFVVWDAVSRRVFCARDVAGIKAFYYHAGPGVFLFASEPQALLAHPAVSRRPNEGMVGEHLSVTTSNQDTLLADVQRLPPAGRLIVSRDACRADTYWSIDPSAEIRYKTVAEYAEHLSALLTEAVRVRLRSAAPVGVLLSGGVDSSSIFGLAASLARQGRVDRGCDAWTLAGEADIFDETPFAAEVVKKHGGALHTAGLDHFPLEEYRRLARSRCDLPPAPNARLTMTLKTRARHAGRRVLLTGFWGDEFFGGSYMHCADLFRSGRWLTLIRKVRAQSRVPEVDLPGPLLKILLWPQLSRSWQKRVKQWIGRDAVPSWVDPAFARRIALADRLFPTEEVPEVPAFPTIADRSIFREVFGGTSVFDAEEDDRAAAELGLEMRHPFADRRVMTFAFAVGEDLRWRDGVRKFVLREAMHDMLPESVGRRQSSPDGAPAFIPAIRSARATGALDAPAIERYGWVDGAVLRRAVDELLSRYDRGDPDYTIGLRAFWRMLAIEIWVQEVVEGRASEEEPWETMVTGA
jgi:asparagine synthase (glutamine-hydrolysing)